MAGLCPPLPTLRLRPRERIRTAWGRCGSLLLHRIGLAPITPCRSPGAQSPQLHQDVRTNRRDFLRRRIARTYASAIERSERSQRRIPPCGYRPKPETTRPTKADEYASGNAGRVAPRMAAQEPPKQPFQPFSETRRAFPIRVNTFDSFFQRYLRKAADRCRRKPAIAGRDFGRLNWAVRALTEVTSASTEVSVIAAIRLRALNGLHMNRSIPWATACSEPKPHQADIERDLRWEQEKGPCRVTGEG